MSGQPVIIGAGLAGLSAALALAPQPVLLLTKSSLGDGAASAWAQGGIAAAVGFDDTPAQHAADTLAAGDGLCDAAAVDQIVAAGPEAIRRLERWGVAFDRTADGAYSLGLEAAHSRRRVLHAGGGDTAGRLILQALIARVAVTPSIRVIEGVVVEELLSEDGRIAGLRGRHTGSGAAFEIASDRIVLATGGVGGLFLHTTNPAGALGQGLALAADAGARLIDLEFVQFHPTALDVGRDPMPLASEAIRGEGAVLIDDLGDPVMTDHVKGDLAPRDIVARAVWRRLRAGRAVFLDARRALGRDFAGRFPTVNAACLAAGIDPATSPIPVRPAAHYHMGGVRTDGRGRTSIPGLSACGEVAATGLHGANRLASNSLLEAVVMGIAVADDLAGAEAGPSQKETRLPPRGAVASGTAAAAPAEATLATIRSLMSSHVGVLRDREGLSAALAALEPMTGLPGATGAAARVARLIAFAALGREESRGSHWRTDFPQSAEPPARREITLDGLKSIIEPAER